MNETADASRTPGVRAWVFIGATLAMLGNYYVYDSIGPVAEQLSRQLGFSDLQIGTLNAIYSLPNIVLVLIGGILTDRYGGRRVVLTTSIICLGGAMLTAVGREFPVMAAGRLVFGLGAETLLVSLLAAISRWFEGHSLALFIALTTSLARLGSYLADRSPSFAHSWYERGWQPPLQLAAAFAAVSVVGALLYAMAEWRTDRRTTAWTRTLSAATPGGVRPQRGSTPAIESPRAVHASSASPVVQADGVAVPHKRIDWLSLLRFRREYWCLVGICVAFYSVIFPFRSTFAIKYFQQAHGLGLAEASRMNSVVFLAAIFATPAFGFLSDRMSRPALLLMLGSAFLPASFLLFASDRIDLWWPTALLGISFSLIPAVLWPTVARYVAYEQRGAAYGFLAMSQSIGLALANTIAGYLNDHGSASGSHIDGYLPMLWFFGLVSLAGFFFAALLKQQTVERPDTRPLARLRR